MSLFTRTLVPVKGVVHSSPKTARLPNGDLAVAFGLVCPHREFNRETRLWCDGEPLFMLCVAFGKRGQAVRATVREGLHVMAMGYLTLRDGEGETPYLHLSSVGVDLEKHQLTVDESAQLAAVPPMPDHPPHRPITAEPSPKQPTGPTPWWSIAR
ncbi:single stranded DNA-binding domain-containing protein [Streptomyces lydicus]|uniref:hypothetical protein n=1 Tax=Streptomyces lydicus TaxID=47763 RepID=UPI0036EA536A